MPGFPVLHIPWNLLRLMFIESMMPSNHLIHCCSLVPLPSIFTSIRIFSNEIALCIRWPKYWNFNFSIRPSNEYTGLIFFRIDWLISLLSKGLSRASPAPQFESIDSSVLSLLYGPTITSMHDYWKNHSFDYIDLCQQNDVCTFVCCLIKELNNHF